MTRPEEFAKSLTLTLEGGKYKVLVGGQEDKGTFEHRNQMEAVGEVAADLHGHKLPLIPHKGNRRGPVLAALLADPLAGINAIHPHLVAVGAKLIDGDKAEVFGNFVKLGESEWTTWFDCGFLGFNLSLPNFVDLAGR